MKKKYSIVIALAPWRDAEILKSIKIQDFSKKNFEIIIEKGLNVCDNRNNGFAKSKGEIIIYLDDDAIIEKDFLTKVDKFLSNYPEVDVLGGPQLTPKDDKLFAKLNGYVLSSLFGSYKMARRYSKRNLTLDADSTFLTGALLIVRRKVLQKIKFDNSFYPGDDVNFVESAKKEGFRIAYDPELYIFHRRRATLSSLVKQIFDYSSVRFNKSLSRWILQSPAVLIPGLFLIYIVTLPTLVLINKYLLLPFIFYIIINLLFSIYESIKNKNILSFFLLPFIFFVVHISYGLGLFYGVIKKLFGKK